LDFILHWSVGFVMGTLIVLPYIFGKWTYDYDNQSWTQICWGPIVNKTTAKKMNMKHRDIATFELKPITSSRFIFYHLIIANVCGIISLAPDLEQLWGGNGLDHSWWSNIFFFHATIDNLSSNIVESITIYMFITVILIWLIVISIAVNAQNDKDSSRENYPIRM